MGKNKNGNIEEYIHRDEAVKVWCDVDCELEWRLFVGCLLAVGILASSIRLGNQLVSMR